MWETHQTPLLPCPHPSLCRGGDAAAVSGSSRAVGCSGCVQGSKKWQKAGQSGPMPPASAPLARVASHIGRYSYSAFPDHDRTALNSTAGPPPEHETLWNCPGRRSWVSHTVTLTPPPSAENVPAHPGPSLTDGLTINLQRAVNMILILQMKELTQKVKRVAQGVGEQVFEPSLLTPHPGLSPACRAS